MAKTTEAVMDLATVSETETNSQLATIQELSPLDSVFGVPGIETLKGILCPERPISIRFDCQKGIIKIVEDPVMGDVTMSILKTESFYGSFTDPTKPTELLQIWFVTESGPLPANTVLVTYIKGRSLGAFNRLISTLIAKRVNPSKGVFKPKFQSYSGDVKVNGVNTKVNYYGLTWDWEPRTDAQRERELIEVLNNPDNKAKMIDPNINNRLIMLGEQSEPPQQSEPSIEDF